MLGGWWVHREFEEFGVVYLVAHALWVIFSIVLHELGHGWAAIRQGDDTPIRLERMTLNPLVHMGPWSLLAFAMIGIAWGVMPVNPSRFRSRRWGDLIVSAAGPAVNLSLAIVLAVATGLVMRFGDPASQTIDNLVLFLSVGLLFNVILLVLNLLPLPPLDGSVIAASLIPPLRPLFNHPNAGVVGLVGLLVLFGTGALGLLYVWPLDIAVGLRDLVAGR